MNRNSRNKSTHNAFHRGNRYAPDTEKTKNMINTDGIKIVSHLNEALVPPFKLIALHLLPVIGGESPVLTVNGKIIRWGTRLHIHMIQPGVHPCVYTIAIDPNRNIS